MCGFLALQRLAEARVSQWHQQQFAQIQDFMTNGVSLDGSILKMKIRDLDFKRQTNLALDHSELAQAIGYTGAQDH